MFRHLRFLVDEKAPATRGQSFKEALGFAHGFVGLKGVSEALSSRRVAGSVQEALDAPPLRRQRPPLTALLVKGVERFILRAQQVRHADHRLEGRQLPRHPCSCARRAVETSDGTPMSTC